MLESVRKLLKITRLACGKSYLVIIALIHMKHWVGSNIAQNHHLPSLVSFLASIQIKNVPKVYPISNTFDLWS